MNRSKIEWTDFTWNPITGCLHGCSYCYARKQALRFAGDVRMNLNDPRCTGDREKMLFVLEDPFQSKERFLSEPFGFYPTLHTYRLDWPGKVKTGENVFVCSMADMFGYWVPEEWILKVFEACRKYPQHNYLFLTKAPGRYGELLERDLLPTEKNFWYGSTATGPAMPVFDSERVNTFVSIEPILEPFSRDGEASYPRADWVIIGAESGNRRDRVTPRHEWIDNLVQHYRNSAVPVFLKDSLEGLMEGQLLQERPESLTLHPISAKQKARRWATCSMCKKERPMKEMIALLSREKRGDGAKRLGYACPECFEELRNMLDSDTPILIHLSDLESR